MHRRKVRTGLTCATLTLLTFVMISFTSVQKFDSEQDIADRKGRLPGHADQERPFRADFRCGDFSPFISKYGGSIQCVCAALGYWARGTGGRTSGPIPSSI